MKLDRLDIKILETLQRDGRITKLNLATQIGLSASPCLERMKKLEDAGYIRGYGAQVSIEKLCRVSFVFAEMTLKSHTAKDFVRFERRIVGWPEVLECHAVGGGFDYIVKFVVRDIQHYQQVIDQLLEADIGIGTYFTYIVTKRIKTDGTVPISRLLAASEEPVASEPADLPVTPLAPEPEVGDLPGVYLAPGKRVQRAKALPAG
jgi:Lrp/AsnC family transcriptional regulator, regulator of ectoine-degradation genes